MIGVNKPFSKDLHMKNDPTSRKLVKEFFAERGIKLKDNPNKFGVDLMTEDSDLLIEVEHRLNWAQPEFPYEEVNVPQRKSKFFAEGIAHYVILSRDYKYLGFINAKSIQKYMAAEYLKESSNRFVKEHEYFYKIPKSEFEFYQVQ